MIYEDLAYALYVYEYSRGHFNMARFYVEKAIEIMSELAPSNQIMLASAKRVKALILEEIALDNMVSPNARDYNGLLKESEELHQSALQLSLDAFGEINVQTAKHYGNLGRLYQSMNKYEDAEEMHQRAIKIKRDLLGEYDYEVGLSVGHLASLYNYHMKKYREAEDLYLKSIDISELTSICSIGIMNLHMIRYQACGCLDKHTRDLSTIIVASFMSTKNFMTTTVTQDFVIFSTSGESFVATKKE